MKKFKTALVQMDIECGKVDTNLKNASELIETAVEEGSELICLPEYFPMGPAGDELGELAEQIPGRITEIMGEIAEEHGVYIVFSMAERSDGSIYNTAVLIGPEGKIIGKHRKMHRFLDEKDVITPGDGYTVVDTELGKLGLMVCYDAVFPEVARNLALLDAEVILMPSNWPDPFKPQWDLATSARAFDNQLWVIAANMVGATENHTYFGGSRIVDPTGKAVVDGDDEEKVIVGTVDLSVIEEFKGIINFLEDRKDDYTG